jgi:nicotinamide mononucleotide (NMN) deamidase PncC
MRMTASLLNTLAELFRRLAAVEVVDGRVHAHCSQLKSDGGSKATGCAGNQGGTTGIRSGHVFTLGFLCSAILSVLAALDIQHWLDYIKFGGTAG